MKGKVLGFDPASGTGAITGDDGTRYNFAAADNKSPAPLKPNDTVDFEAEGNAAKNIYAVKTGFSMPTGGAPAAGGAAPAAGGDFVAMLMVKPSLIWAAIIILGALAGNYLGVFNAMGQMGQFGSMMPAGFQMAMYLSMLLILIPIAAGVLIYFELTGHKLTAMWRFVTAVAAIAGPIVIPILAGMMISSSMGGFGGMMGPGFGFRIDLGTILVVGGGVLLLLTHLGYIKKLG
jgi:hypothetical protein